MAATVSVSSRLSTYGRFVAIEHTVFSIPVILAGTFLAAGGWPRVQVLLMIVLAGTGARTAALGLNRIIDRRIDAQNPRTADRGLPAGDITIGEAWGVVVIGSVVYFLSAAAFNRWCLILSPIPMAAFMGYPYLKRVTPLAHYGVGFCLGLAPCGGWMAVRGTWDGFGPAMLLGLFTWGWVAGFDIIYACLDADFDRKSGLHSLPAHLGIPRALRIAALTHFVAFAALLLLALTALDGRLTYLLLAGVAGLFVLEHRYAHDTDLAFFKINTIIGCVVFLQVWAGLGG